MYVWRYATNLLYRLRRFLTFIWLRGAVLMPEFALTQYSDPPTTNRGCQLSSTTSPHVLRVGIDWWENYAAGSLSDEASEWLSACLDGDGVGEWVGEWYRVERTRNPWRARVVHVVSGVEFVVNAKGAFLTARGGVCTRYGAYQAHSLAREILYAFGTFMLHTVPTRVDVAVDVMGWRPVYPAVFRLSGRGGYLRPTFHGMDVDAGTFETVEVGKRGDNGAGIMLVVYNKSKQLVDVRHDADYADMLSGDWRLNGWVDGVPVWRVEVRCWRSRLESAGLTAYDALTEPWRVVRLGVDWADLSGSEGGSDGLWEHLREISGVPSACVRSNRARRVPSQDSLAAQCMRLVARFAAAHGSGDMDSALQALAYGCHVMGKDGAYERKVDEYRREYGRYQSALMGD